MKKSTIVWIVILVLILLVVVGSFGVLVYNSSQEMAVDAGRSSLGMNYIGSQMKMDAASANYIGFSVGGAKDIENFRENIKNGYFPISTDITYNGIFYDYMFDTGVDNSARTGDENLFFPSYSTAISKDPISNEKEYYMTVGLNSNIKEEDFQRKNLNLLILLDISGSMGSRFDRYYYDDPLQQYDFSETKMKIADKAVCTLIDQLRQEDRIGIVTFESSAQTVLPITKVSDLNLGSIKNDIMEITDRGGTNFSEGYIKANAEMKKFKNADKDTYENRIIVITDAMPNYGVTSSDSLMGMVKSNASDGIFTTFIGVGVDFNTKLIEEISDVKGANYYSVHSAEEFDTRMGEQFEYMVTPLVFDLSLDVSSKDYTVEAIYGSDTANAKTGNIMNVNTLFPSASESGEVKGGVILLKVSPKHNDAKGEIEVSVSYKDRNGQRFEDTQKVSFKDASEEYYDNTGIRKSIVLVRYVNVLKNWILYERSAEKRFLILPVTGIIDGYKYDEDFVVVALGEHERTSVKLFVGEEYKETFKTIKDYMQKENEELKDKTFEKEFDAIDILIKADAEAPKEEEPRIGIWRDPYDVEG